jgi:hypothetical protein
MKLTHTQLREIIREDLRKWFGTGKTGSVDGGGWDRYNLKGEKIGKCGDAEEGEPYVACLSKEKADKLGPKGRASFVRRKREAQKKAGDAKKGGEQTKGQKPVLVKTKANEMNIKLEEKLTLFLEKNTPTDSGKWSYAVSQAKEKFDVYPSAYANAWAAKKYKELGGGWRTEESLVKEDNPCWEGYKKIGMKMKNGKEVPNCVPINELINESKAELELSKMITGLKIKDKELESVIRTLVFSNTPRVIEQVMLKYMPEFN